MQLPMIVLMHLIWGLAACEKYKERPKWDVLTRIRENNGLFEEFYNRSLVPTCDSTVNVCDLNCCFDKDCQIKDVEAFSCAQEPPVERSAATIDSLYCYSKENLNQIFCYEFENSPFLGDFLPDVETIREQFPESNRFGFKQVKVEDSEPVSYKFGSLLVEEGPLGSVVFPGSILGKGYCSLSPIKYLVNQDSNCPSNVTREACGRVAQFNLEHYLKINTRKQMLYPKVKSGIGHSLATTFFKINGTRDWPINRSVASLNENSRSCRNVVTQVEWLVFRRGNEIQNISISVDLTDVPLNTAINRKFRVLFKKSQSQRRSDSSGYSLGDPVRLNRIDEESHNLSEELPKKWRGYSLGKEKRCLGTGLKFGYDTVGHCLFTHEEGFLCEDLRHDITRAVVEEMNFESVDNGVGSTIRHLREGVKEIEDFPANNETNELCPVVKKITIKIIYKFLTNKTNRYEILGVTSEIQTGSCSVESTTCMLHWTAEFSRFQPRSTVSRWSEYIWSPIGSSYSWVHIFDWGLNTFNPRPDLIDESITFNLIFMIISLLLILRKYY